MHPTLQKKCKALISKCKAQGIDIVITQTLRTKAEQDGYYAQGRSKPGDIVTGVRYPYSNHCWGVAFDFAVKVRGQITWNKAYYLKVGPIGKSLGLEWGGYWKHQDSPHFQLSGFEAEELVMKYSTLKKFMSTWEVEEELKEVPVVMEGKVALQKGGINENGKLCVPAGELIEKFNLDLVVNYVKGKGYIRRKKEGE